MARDALLENLERLQNMLIARATGGGDDEEYEALRAALLKNARIANALPSFVRTCRTSFQFWQFIKYKFSSYAERREFI